MLFGYRNGTILFAYNYSYYLHCKENKRKKKKLLKLFKLFDCHKNMKWKWNYTGKFSFKKIKKKFPLTNFWKIRGAILFSLQTIYSSDLHILHEFCKINERFYEKLCKNLQNITYWTNRDTSKKGKKNETLQFSSNLFKLMVIWNAIILSFKSINN